MGLVAAKCPECGANINVEESKDAGICEYCGTAFITEKVINNNYINVVNNNDLRGANIIVHNNEVNIDGIILFAKRKLEEEDLKITEAESCLDDIIRKTNDGTQRIIELFRELGYYKIAEELIEHGEFSNESYERIILALLMKYDYDNLVGWMAYWKVSKECPQSFSAKEAKHFLQLIPSDDREAYEKEIYLDFAFSAATNSRYYEYIDAIPDDYVSHDQEIQDALIESTYLIEIANMLPNEKQERIRCIEKKLPKNKVPEINQRNVNSPNKGGCYIATCVYGSYDCPQVWTLRRFRDYTLDTTWYGRVFIKMYYAISPSMVKWFGETNWFKEFFQFSLDKLIFKLNKKGIVNTFYRDKY